MTPHDPRTCDRCKQIEGNRLCRPCANHLGYDHVIGTYFMKQIYLELKETTKNGLRKAVNGKRKKNKVS